ncbi:hypothetical protein EFP18_25730 [Burkholderia glumae]|uniref:hypothetical protein n=1 Tax=Burkholderia glumae TaxID=337 RepID=UPI000F5E1472|nr:hypothetical protein [Burkholderia glumae]MCQ0032307.1 hypothetical protein [Burkholderia glumae]MCQ0039200.1 hypothetical protein [Burkholderia glumae]RQZ72455.1 hypothetical protein DF052_16230 [Burkholderia glumae]UVS87437.1 hypothetical protein EFP18_25730 [Burkholderia glumae]
MTSAFGVALPSTPLAAAIADIRQRVRRARRSRHRHLARVAFPTARCAEPAPQRTRHDGKNYKPAPAIVQKSTVGATHRVAPANRPHPPRAARGST